MGSLTERVWWYDMGNLSTTSTKIEVFWSGRIFPRKMRSCQRDLYNKTQRSPLRVWWTRLFLPLCWNPDKKSNAKSFGAHPITLIAFVNMRIVTWHKRILSLIWALSEWAVSWLHRWWSPHLCVGVRLWRCSLIENCPGRHYLHLFAPSLS